MRRRSPAWATWTAWTTLSRRRRQTTTSPRDGKSTTTRSSLSSSARSHGTAPTRKATPDAPATTGFASWAGGLRLECSLRSDASVMWDRDQSSEELQSSRWDRTAASPPSPVSPGRRPATFAVELPSRAETRARGRRAGLSEGRSLHRSPMHPKRAGRRRCQHRKPTESPDAHSDGLP